MRAILVLPLLVACGCTSLMDGGRAAKLESDVRRSRDEAFEAWRRAREGQETTQPTVKGALTVDAAQLLAMGNNKQLQAIVQEREIARGRVTEAWSDALPKLSLDGGYTRLDKVSSLAAGPVSVTMGSVNNYSLALTLRQPIFRGGAVSAGIRAARIYTLMADQEVKGVVQAVLFQARKAYSDVLLARELTKVSQADLALARRTLDDAQKKRNQGAATEFDVLRARVEVSNVEAELIQRQNALNLSKNTLLKILGVSQDSEVELAGPLAYEPMTARLADAVGEAFRKRPELLQAELAVRLQREAVVAARAGWWPKADLFVSEEYAKPDPHSITKIDWGHAWTAGATVSMPLFDGFRTAGKVQQELARLKKQQIGLLDTEEQVLLDVKQAMVSIEDAERFVKSQAENLDRAREGLRLAEASYREGVTSEVAVLDARQALSQTQALHYKALYDHTVARLLLERATGMLQPPGKGDEK